MESSGRETAATAAAATLRQPAAEQSPVPLSQHCINYCLVSSAAKSK